MTASALPPQVRRHFVTIGGTRQIHYLRAGAGIPVLLLHPSPGPSRYLADLIGFLSQHFTVIAPDTPGNGLSDPLPMETPSMDDFGDNVALFLDALGIKQIAVYGFHTGASIGTAFAIRHPDRVLGAILDGFLVETDQSLADRIAHYLLPFEPCWDGSHLTWLWDRVRCQETFAPWYAPTLAHRLDREASSPDRLHRTVMDWLLSGAEYIKPYSAAFRQRGEQVVHRFSTPTVICAASTDSLAAHLDRLPDPLPAEVEVIRLGSDQKENHAFFLEQLRRFAAGAAPPPPAPNPLQNGSYRDYVDVAGGQLHLRRTAETRGRPIVVQHRAGADSALVDELTASFYGTRTALSIDLPGCGDSDNTFSGDDFTIEALADTVAEALDHIGVAEYDGVGHWGGGSVLLELARRGSGINRLAMVDPLNLSAAFAEELAERHSVPVAPDRFGGHLTMAWGMVRDRYLYWPWYRPSRETIVWQEPPTPEALHRAVVSFLKTMDMEPQHARAEFRYDFQSALKNVASPILLASPLGSPLAADAREASALSSAAQHASLPGPMTDWVPQILKFLDS